MKNKLAFISLSVTLLIAAVFLALPQRPVSAQTCRDARGNVIPCPEKKKKTPTPVRPTRTPTPPPTLTPSVTPAVSPTPTAFPSLPIIPGGDGPPLWLLGGGLLLGLLIVGFIIYGKHGIDGNPGEEKGALNAYVPPPDGDLGGPDTNNPPDGDMQANNPPDPDMPAANPPDGDMQAINPPDPDMPAANPPDPDMPAQNPPDGDMQATNPPDGDMQATNPPDPDMPAAQNPPDPDLPEGFDTSEY